MSEPDKNEPDPAVPPLDTIDDSQRIPPPRPRPIKATVADPVHAYTACVRVVNDQLP